MFQRKRMLVTKLTPGKESPHPVYVEKTPLDQLTELVGRLVTLAAAFGLGIALGAILY